MCPVITYEKLDEAIGFISDRGKPLALYIYSNTPGNVERILSRTSSGGVTVNGVFSHYLENHLPFGGVNQSGMGSYHGVFGFKAFIRMNVRSMCRERGKPAARACAEPAAYFPAAFSSSIFFLRQIMTGCASGIATGHVGIICLGLLQRLGGMALEIQQVLDFLAARQFRRPSRRGRPKQAPR